MSAFKQSFTQKQVQNLSLSYGMKLSLELLQLNSLQLKEYLEKELLDNPMFEVDMTMNFSSVNPDGFDIMDHKKSLQDDLMLQITDRKINLSIVETILRNCDCNGYLLVKREELAEILHVTQAELAYCFDCIHACQPYGIASRDLRECLSIQMKQRYPQEQLALNIIEKHLDDIAKNYLAKIAIRHQMTQEEVKRCIALIQTLDPRPASEYDLERIVFVKPDVIVEVVDEEVKLLMPAYFNIKENEYYKGYSMTKEDKDFINEKRQQGKVIIECLEHRKETLHNIMKIMADQQKGYLLHQDCLQYLIMKDIGESLSMHETTISRAMKDKYFAFEGQVYPMNKLLCKQVHNTSVDVIVDKIKMIIAKELDATPLSDQKISDTLKEEGIVCSRRTVTKYRVQHHIPSAQTRKRRKDHIHG